MAGVASVINLESDSMEVNKKLMGKHLSTTDTTAARPSMVVPGNGQHDGQQVRQHIVRSVNVGLPRSQQLQRQNAFEFRPSACMQQFMCMAKPVEECAAPQLC